MLFARLVKFIFCFYFTTTSLTGQKLVSGVVLDGQSRQALVGATLSNQSGSIGTISDVDGKFSFEVAENTSDTILVSYIGYEDQEVLLSPTIKQLEILLSTDGVSLDEVVISGIIEGQIKAMVEMKKAENIKNIVTAEQIKLFPDLNAADVMQRLPGITLQRDQGEGRFVQLRGTPPELTNFNINGEQIPSPEGGVRYVGLDIIPSDQIESIEVTKVMTPDMDGDGIGGSVDIKTKIAKRGRPQLGVTMAGGYNQLRETLNSNLQFSFGQRFDKVGFQINASFFENNQGSDNIEYKFTKGPFFNSDSQGEGVDNFNLHYREVQLRHYDITRRRIAVSPTLDYKLNDDHYFYAKGMHNSFVDDEVRRRLIYDLEDPLNRNYFLFGGVTHDTRERVKTQNLSTLAIGATHDFGFLQLDYQVFGALAGEQIPDFFEASFDSPGQAITINFDESDIRYPKAEFPNESNAVNVTRYDDYELDEMTLGDAITGERLFTPRINLQIPYSFGEVHSGFFKFGAKLRSRIKSRNVRSQVFGAYRPSSILYPGSGGELNLLTASDDFQVDNLLGQAYSMVNMPSSEVIDEFYEFYPQYFIYDRNETRKTSYNADYTYREDISAIYGMIRHDVGRLMVLAGVRYESTSINENRAFGVKLNGSRFIGIDTIDVQNTRRFLLPQIQMKYELTQNINLRGALTYSYARPNYDDIIPSRSEDRNEVSIGNPDLEFPFSRNLDLMVERYFKKSILSAGLFHKNIEDFVFSYKRFGREGAPGSGNFPVFELTKPLNGKNANVYGAELQAQFKFSLLPGIFKNFGLYTNYTYTYSEAFIPRRQPANYAEAIILDPFQDDISSFFDDSAQERISLPGQAQHTANVALFYDVNDFFIRLSANYQDEFLLEIGPDPDFDEYYDQSLRLDLTANYQITEKINLFTDWINLTNAPLRVHLGDTEVTKQQEFYSWWSRIGLRINL